MKKVLLLFIGLLFANSLVANTNEHEKLAKRFFNESALKLHIKYDLQSFKARVRRFQKSYSPEGFYAYLKLVDVLYNKTRSTRPSDQDYIKLIKKELSLRDLKKIVQWLNSPSGNKITQARRDNLTKEGAKEFYRYQPKSRGQLRDQERKELLQQIEALTKTTEIVLEIANSHSQTLKKLILSKESLEVLSRRVTKRKVKFMREHVYQTQIKKSQYLLRNFSNEELKEYIHFLQSKAGKKMMSVSKKIIITSKPLPKKIPAPIEQRELPLIAKKINEELPKMMANKIRLDFSAAKEATLIYHYTLLNPPNNESEKERL